MLLDKWPVSPPTGAPQYTAAAARHGVSTAPRGWDPQHRPQSISPAACTVGQEACGSGTQFGASSCREKSQQPPGLRTSSPHNRGRLGQQGPQKRLWGSSQPQTSQRHPASESKFQVLTVTPGAVPSCPTTLVTCSRPPRLTPPCSLGQRLCAQFSSTRQLLGKSPSPFASLSHHSHSVDWPGPLHSGHFSLVPVVSVAQSTWGHEKV